MSGRKSIIHHIFSKLGHGYTCGHRREREREREERERERGDLNIVTQRRTSHIILDSHQ